MGKPPVDPQRKSPREEFTGPLFTATNLRVLWEMKKDENRLHGRNGRRQIGVRKP